MKAIDPAEAEAAGIIAERLEIALGAKKPIPASNVEECREVLPVEMLIPNDKRQTVTIDDHAEWQHHLAGGGNRTRSQKEVQRVLDLLDELDGNGGPT